MYIIKRILKLLYFLSQFTPLAFVWMGKAFLIDTIRKFIAFKELPGFAEEVGLKPRNGDFYNDLKGVINKHDVQLRPGTPYIRVYHKKEHKNLYISHIKINFSLGKNAVSFQTDNWKFNMSFKSKLVDKSQISAISENQELITKLADFYDKWMFVVDDIIVSDMDVYCRLMYGFHFFPYIPTRDLRMLLSELVEISECVDGV